LKEVNYIFTLMWAMDRETCPKCPGDICSQTKAAASIFCKPVIWNMVLIPKWHKNLNSIVSGPVQQRKI